MDKKNNQAENSPKLQQFLDELNTLQDKYLYQISPVLQVTVQGIIPVIKVIDKIPPKTEELKNKETK
jgi:hypothetical protein